MGTFYTNLNLNLGYSEAAHQAISKRFTSGWIIDAGDWLTICAEDIEQNLPETTARLADLTAELRCRGAAVLNHDDGLLVLLLMESGERLFSYHSDPGYFSSGASDAGPEITGFERLRDWDPAVNEIAVRKLLKSPDYVFAQERHAHLATALGLPASSIGASEKYLADGEYPDGVDQDSVIEIP
ncbi:hypothetical protein LBMAG53_14460 [Planctomycetota bacterium]|nr:hypothetical protein LBMAG53_14460 [Planctomycetota bacterium]